MAKSIQERISGLFRAKAQAGSLSDELGALRLTAKDVARTVLSGLRNQQKSGPGIEFFEFQPFDPDRHEIRQIDSAQSAKAGMDIVRLRQREQHHSLYLWRDGRPGMNWHGALTAKDSSRLAESDSDPANEKQRTKRQVADILLMAAAEVATESEERVALIDGEARPAANSNRIVDELALPVAKNVWTSLGRAGRQLPARSHAVIFSDFLPDPHNSIDDMREAVALLAGLGVRGHLVQILDAAEIDFPFEGNTEFNALSNDDRLRLGRAEQYRADYQNALQAHVTRIAAIAEEFGWGYSFHRTDRPLHEGLLPLYEPGQPVVQIPDLMPKAKNNPAPKPA